MSKYIIDTDQFEKLFEIKGVAVLGIGDNPAVPEEGEKTVWTRMLNVADLEELTADYINEHFGDLQDTTYQKGFEDGKKEAESSEAIEQAKADAFNKGMLFKEEKIHDAYQRGLEEGKAQAERGCKGCEYEGKTGEHLPCEYCKNNFRSQWTAKDDKIEVGDEVADKYGDKTIVTNIHGDLFDGLCSDGSTMMDLFLDDNHKTGRHFNIQSILEAMKHD